MNTNNEKIFVQKTGIVKTGNNSSVSEIVKTEVIHISNMSKNSKTIYVIKQASVNRCK